MEGGAGCPVADPGDPFPIGRADDGPSGAGEFFFGDYYYDGTGGHNETTLGAIAVLSGTNEVVAAHYDPIRDDAGIFFAQGLLWHDITTGGRFMPVSKGLFPQRGTIYAR